MGGLCVAFVLLGNVQGRGNVTEATQGTGAQQQGATPAASGATPEAGSQQGATPADFDSWLDRQGEDVKSLISTRMATLTTTLESERNDRKSVVAQLKAIQAEGDPKELKTKVATLEATLAEQATRNEFAEGAVSQGVTNIRLAYLAAKDADLLGKKDLWEQLKAKSPELFRKAVPGNAGAGSGAAPAAGVSMNQLLRGR